jgi:hypothetical protein
MSRDLSDWIMWLAINGIEALAAVAVVHPAVTASFGASAFRR